MIKPPARAKEGGTAAADSVHWYCQLSFRRGSCVVGRGTVSNAVLHGFEERELVSQGGCSPQVEKAELKSNHGPLRTRSTDLVEVATHSKGVRAFGLSMRRRTAGRGLEQRDDDTPVESICFVERQETRTRWLTMRGVGGWWARYGMTHSVVRFQKKREGTHSKPW